MRYATLEIRPKIDGRGWDIRAYDIPYDRETSDGSLSALGFFHYPRKIGREMAFERLKSHMLARHAAEIAKLAGSMESLSQLENPYIKNTRKRDCEQKKAVGDLADSKEA